MKTVTVKSKSACSSRSRVEDRSLRHFLPDRVILCTRGKLRRLRCNKYNASSIVGHTYASVASSVVNQIILASVVTKDDPNKISVKL